MNTLVGLPVMAILISLAAGIPFQDIATTIVSEGSLRLHNPMIVIIFGAALAEIVNKSGIVEVLIKNTAEFLSDRVYLISILLFLVIALLFTVLGGLGAIVMVGSIVFPIMISLGISKLTSSCIFLLGISLGGTLNLVNWSLYMEVLKLSQSEILRYIIYFLPMALVISIFFIVWEIRKEGGSSFKKKTPNTSGKKLNSPHIAAFLTPVVPVVLVFAFGIKSMFFSEPGKGFDFPIIAAMFIGIVYGIFTAPRHLGSKVKLLTKSLFDGISNVAPALVLMIGIGMLLKAVAHPIVKELLGPMMTSIVPRNALSYIIFFTVLAPLALYRGPLNLWGMGSGLITLIKDTAFLPATSIMAALQAVGQIQGVCDPTNTHNVWIANYMGIDVIKIMKKTILYMWVTALLGLIIAAILYF